ncbi:MAG: hypothetical protein ACRCVG_04410 [Methanobacteriaceae archaeon]
MNEELLKNIGHELEHSNGLYATDKVEEANKMNSDCVRKIDNTRLMEKIDEELEKIKNKENKG